MAATARQMAPVPAALRQSVLVRGVMCGRSFVRPCAGAVIMDVVAEEYAPGVGRVAVLGLGTMGAGMARSLLRAGLPVDVWNRTPERAAALAGAGAVAHADPASAVAHAGVVITMLSDAAAVRAVALDAGMLAAMAPGAVWAQIGTIGVAGTGELAGAVAATRSDVL